MLSAHYTGGSPAHHPMLSSHPGQQAQYHQHTLSSSLLPTPPSSPPTIGMHPVENTISLLESLVAFYHQERMWVYRTRAQLEMGFHRAPDFQSDGSIDAQLDDDPDSPGQSQSASSPDSSKGENTSPSPPTKWLKRKKAFNLRLEGISATRSMLPTVARGGITKHPHPHTQHRARQSSNLNPASSHQNAMPPPTPAAMHSRPMASPNPTASFYPPTAVNAPTTVTSPYLSHPSFQLPASQGPLTPGMPTSRYVSASHHAPSTPQPLQAHQGPFVIGAGGREPAVQILEMFERMMQARMESCERVTRMVRDAAKPGGAAGVVGGVNVGGPAGGFGGPVLPGYPHVQSTAETPAVQTPAPQGFQM